MTSIERCGHCFVKNIIDLKRILLIGTGAYFGYWLIVGLIMGLIITGGSSGEKGFYAIIALLSCNAMASGIFGDMKKKEGRINVLMQPASVAEKFWARLILATIIPAIVVFIGFFILEIGRLIGTAITTKQLISIIYPWDFLTGTRGIDILILITGFLAIQCYYFFGAILWPKISFLKSLAILALIQMIVITSAAYIVKSVGNNPVICIDIINNSIDWWILSFNIIMMGLFGWFAYLRLKKSTVIYGLIQ